jgi:uncharacterized damage-inducible protein DinB
VAHSSYRMQHFAYMDAGAADRIWSRLVERIDDVRALVRELDDGAWRRTCAGEGWSVALVLCHVTLGLRRQAGWVERAVRGRAAHSFNWERTHALNALVWRRARDVRREHVEASLDAAAERWRTVLLRASDADLARAAFRYDGVERPVEWVAGVLAPRHVDEHMRSVRAAASTR